MVGWLQIYCVLADRPGACAQRAARLAASSAVRDEAVKLHHFVSRADGADGRIGSCRHVEATSVVNMGALRPSRGIAWALAASATSCVYLQQQGCWGMAHPGA